MVVAVLPTFAQTSTINQRVALVIGNSSYSAGPLLNPVNDARSMAIALKETGFEVLKYEDVKTLSDMKRIIREFGNRIQNGGVGLFYYAGHGIQVNGRNYLIPTEAEIYREEEVEYESMDVGFVLAQMESARNRMNILILDACRNNPFARSWRSSAQGLAFINAPTGTLIAYATAPGSVASDGTGENGLYTQELLKQIRQQGLKIEDVFKQVRAAVIAGSNEQQTPWESSSLVGDFYFIEPETEPVTPESITDTPVEDSSDPDIDLYRPLNLTWKARNNQYVVYLDNQDITSETVNAGCGEHLLVYHTTTGRTFYLDYFWTKQDNVVRPGWTLPALSTTFWMSINDKYWFFDTGIDITADTKIASYDEHKVIFNTKTRQYYWCYKFNEQADGYPRSAVHVASINGTLWRYDGQYYYLYVEGDQVAARTFAQWRGNDLIVYDEAGSSSYLLADLYNRKDNMLRSAKIIASNGMIAWKKEYNRYLIYRDGESFASLENTVADVVGDDLMVYDKIYKQTYLLQDWNILNDGQLRDAKILFSQSNVFWIRMGDSFSFYREGRLITYQLTAHWSGDDLEVYDPSMDITYVFPLYRFAERNTLKAAFIKQ